MAYRTDQDKIRRQRMLAEMLQQGGMSPIQQQSAGGLPVAISPLQGFNKVAQTALGAYGGYRADKREAELEEKRKAGMQDWISAMPQDRNELMAWALRGEEFGDTGQAVGNNVLAQTLSPQSRNVKVVGDRLYDVDANQWVEMPEGGSPAGIGKVTPSHYTPESIARYAETGDYNVLERYEAGRTVKGSDGLDYTFDPVTRQWYPMAVSPLPAGGSPQSTMAGQPPEQPATEQPQVRTLDDVARSRAALTEAETAAKAGMRRDENGNWVPIEGSPNQRKLEAAAKQRKEMIKRRAPGVLRDVRRAMEQADAAGPIAGPIAAPGGESSGTLRRIMAAGSPAFELNQHLESIKSNISIEELQSMRESSPTGGALGQIPVRQQEFLMQMLGSLSPSLDEEVLRENLSFVHNNYLEALLDATYGDAEEIETALRDGKISQEQAQSLQAERQAMERELREDAGFDEFGRRSGPAQIKTDEEYDALPPGTEFIAPDGTRRRKP